MPPANSLLQVLRIWVIRGENSGIHLIVVRADGLEGAADKRREGTVSTLDAD